MVVCKCYDTRHGFIMLCSQVTKQKWIMIELFIWFTKIGEMYIDGLLLMWTYKSIHQAMNLQKTFCTPLSWTSCGVSSVSISQKIENIKTRPYCIMQGLWTSISCYKHQVSQGCQPDQVNGRYFDLFKKPTLVSAIESRRCIFQIRKHDMVYRIYMVINEIWSWGFLSEIFNHIYCYNLHIEPVLGLQPNWEFFMSSRID